MYTNKLFKILLKILPVETAYAHCDIPCGVYDVHGVQMAAHTVLRMTQLLSEVKRENETKAEHDVARLTHVRKSMEELLKRSLEL